MKKLTEQDVNAGWADALETEWDYTTNAIDMCNEEVAGKKLQVKETDLQIEGLRVEIDDLEIDMDYVCVPLPTAAQHTSDSAPSPPCPAPKQTLTSELEQLEAMRKLEIDLCTEQWRNEVNRRVLQQKQRWAARWVRKGIVKRLYDERRERAVEEKIKAAGGIERMGVYVGKTSCCVSARSPSHLVLGCLLQV